MLTASMQMVDMTTSVSGRLGMIVALIDRILVIVADVEDFPASSAVAIVFVVWLGAGLELMDFCTAGSIAGSWIAIIVQLLFG